MARTSGLGSGVGLGWRRELAAPLLAAPRSVDFIEVVAESCFAPSPLRKEVLALAELWKERIIPHGIKLSLGSADGLLVERARRLGELARALKAPVISEHVAFTGCRGHGREPRREIGHLTQLPLTRAAVAVVARNVAQARRYLPDVPLLLETPAWSLRWPEDEMDEGTFFHEIVAATGCELLLDLSNLYANAQNSGTGITPLDLLRSYPLERVAMLHLAGGAWREGFYVDTHAHPTPLAVFALLEELLRVTGPIPIIFERDGNYPPFAELAEELERARRLLDAAPKASPKAAPSFQVPAAAATSLELSTLADRQARLCELLTVAEPPLDTAPFDRQAIARSRSILHHKRLDEAQARARFPRPPAMDNPRRPLCLAWVRKMLGN